MKAPYALIPVIILVLLVYSASFLASRFSIIKRSTHRKFWNSLLLLTFFTTACLGLILAIQVNYKIKIGIIENILVWHVDFGIALAVIAIFHFSWHLKYYADLFRKSGKGGIPSRDKQPDNGAVSRHGYQGLSELPLRWIVVVLGLSAIITQVILLREFMSTFYGNELVLGVVLSNWMILTGLGAFLGRFLSRFRNGVNLLFFSLIAIGTLPLLTVFLLNVLKNIVFIEGSMVGLLQVFAWSGILLIPYCLLSGSLFTYLSHHVSLLGKENLIYRVYSLEAIGSVLGGILFNFILVFFLKTFQSLFILLTINLFFAMRFFPGRRKPLILLPVTTFWVFMLIASFFLDLDVFTKQRLFRNQELVYLKETPYGNLAITKTGEQFNFYEDYVLLFNTLNPIANEENVHYAMVQHPDPKSVLVISGGISGMLDEILKYPVERIDYVEINPWLVRAAREHLHFNVDQKVHIYHQDARLFIRRSSEKYDVILIHAPPPGTAQTNRYYTCEFFLELKKSLTPSGIVALALPSTMNYISEEAAEVLSITYNTLNEVFTYVDIIPGEQNFFLASEEKISLQIAKRIEEKGIENEYVNQYYIDDQLLQARRNTIMQSLDPEAELNLDFTPRAYLKQIVFWLSYFDFNYWFIWIPLFILIPILIVRWNPIQTGMFTCGFSASAIEILLLIAFQILYGYVYQVTGIIITLFMAGLAAGPYLQRKILPGAMPGQLTAVQILIGIFAMILPFLFLLFRIMDPGSGLTHALFFLLTFLISVLTGIFFSLATTLMKGNVLQVASGLYGSDLIGSALGALLVAALLFPLLGLIKVALLIGVLNFIAALFIWLRRKRLSDNFVT